MLSRMVPSSPPAMRTFHLLKTPDILCANDSRQSGHYYSVHSARMKRCQIASTARLANRETRFSPVNESATRTDGFLLFPNGVLSNFNSQVKKYQISSSPKFGLVEFQNSKKIKFEICADEASRFSDRGPPPCPTALGQKHEGGSPMQRIQRTKGLVRHLTHYCPQLGIRRHGGANACH
jgi:hypothetical protein